MISFLLTADYELFLGRNFLPAEEVLFQPTERLLECCAGLGISATFFADVCSVWAHRQAGLHDFADRFEAQMIAALKAGHDVQLHLHPHWLSASRDNEVWQVADGPIYMPDLVSAKGQEGAANLLRQGVDYLNRLFVEHRPDYCCLAYRSGGLAMQPNEKKIVAALAEAGLVIDSSLVKGVRMRTDTVDIDYRALPKQANWRMSADGGLTVAASQGVFEIPIGSFRPPLFSRLAFLWRRAAALTMRRGSAISRAGRQSRFHNFCSLLRANLRYLGATPFTLSCDTKGLDSRMLIDGFQQYLGDHQGQEDIMVAMLVHPKLIFEPQIRLLEEFIQHLRKLHGDELVFVTCQQAWHEVLAKKNDNSR